MCVSTESGGFINGGQGLVCRVFTTSPNKQAPVNNTLKVTLVRFNTFKGAIEDIFGKQAESQKGRNIGQEKHLLAAVQKEQVKEACARLIAVRNLPHTVLD